MYSHSTTLTLCIRRDRRPYNEPFADSSQIPTALLSSMTRREMVRSKMDFGIPLNQWLRGPLRGLTESLSGELRLADGDILDPGPIRAPWSDNLPHRGNIQYPLWFVLMFQVWRERWRATL